MADVKGMLFISYNIGSKSRDKLLNRNFPRNREVYDCYYIVISNIHVKSVSYFYNKNTKVLNYLTGG
jgi:hypothetical protein